MRHYLGHGRKTTACGIRLKGSKPQGTTSDATRIGCVMCRSQLIGALTAQQDDLILKTMARQGVEVTQLRRQVAMLKRSR